MKLFLKTAPILEPISIDEVRAFLKLSEEQERETLPTLISAARAHVESITGRVLLRQEWQLELTPPYPSFSPLVRRVEQNVVIHLPNPPLLKVTAVTSRGEGIPFQQEDSNIILSPHFWEKDISITFWAGYGEVSESLPPDLKMAVLMVIRSFYDDRPVDMALLRPFRVMQIQ